MKEYIVLSKEKSPVNSFLSCDLTGRALVAKDQLKRNTFGTFEQALAFANTLDYGVTIYESVAKIEIKHEMTKINENTNDFASEQAKLSRSGIRVTN